MADTPTPPTLPDAAATQTAIDQTNAASAAAQNYTASVQNNTTAIIDNVKNGLDPLSNAARAATAAIFGVSGATDAFAKGLDTKTVVTFSGQIKEVFEAISQGGTVAEDLKNGVLSLAGSLGKMGQSIPSDILRDFALGTEEGITKMKNYMLNIVKAGDEFKIMTQATIAQSAAAGGLNEMLGALGDNLNNVHNVMSGQQKVWDSVQALTGLSAKTVAEYAGELNKVPGVLKTFAGEAGNAVQTTKLFSDMVNFSRITGRDFIAMTKDMSTVARELGVDEKQAFEYTKNLAAGAQAAGVPFDLFHGAVSKSVQAFRMFNSEGKSGIDVAKNMEATMAGYIKTLRQAGLSMSNATEMGEHMTGALNEMGIAQKAFLSGITGGPGGLMGAFQIEKMLDEGKIDQVFGKVQSALRKQFGRIVTTEEASRSQAAAEQMTRQMLILRQGPLGSFAKSDAEARRLLESMAKGRSPEQAIKEMKKDQPESTEALLVQGNKIAQGTYSLFQQFLVGRSELEHAAAGPAARISEQAFGGATYFRAGAGDTMSPEAMEERRQQQRRHAQPGAVSSMESAMKDLGGLPAAVKSTIGALLTAIKGGNKETIEQARANFQKSITDSQAKMSAEQRKEMDARIKNITLGINQTEAATTGSKKIVSFDEASKSKAGAEQFQQQMDMLKKSYLGSLVKSDDEAKKLLNSMAARGQTMQSLAGNTTMTPAQMEAKTKEYMSTHKGLSRSDAIAQMVAPLKEGGAARTGTGAAAPGTGGPGGRPMPVSLAPGTTINVHFTGVCPHCKQHIDQTEAQKIVQGTQ